MNNIVQFHEHKIELVNKNGQLYLSGAQIGRVIELAQNDGVAKIYNRHKDEFTDDMTMVTRQGRSTVRLFNREGAWLIGMFARTPKAAEFRRWVLKVLKTAADGTAVPALPVADAELKDWCASVLALSIENRVKKAVETERKRILEQIKAIAG